MDTEVRNKQGPPTTRYLVKNEFFGMDNSLRIWNTVCVAMNLCEHINDSLAQRYLEMNLYPEDERVACIYAKKIHKLRHPQYGLRKGDIPSVDDMGVHRRVKEWQ